jgi:hypothetical protein
LGANEWSVIGWERKGRKPSVEHYPAIIRFLGYEPWPEPRTLAEALIAERRRRGLAICAAAAAMGVDEGTWGRWEKGEWKPTSRTLPMIDAFLGLPTVTRFPGQIR